MKKATRLLIGATDPLDPAIADTTVDFNKLCGSGATPRQIDYWTRAGYLRLAIRAFGPGVPRCWRPGEQDVAAIMVRLIKAGLTPRAAEVVARGSRSTVDGRGTVSSEIAEGVRVIIEDPKAHPRIRQLPQSDAPRPRSA